LPAGEPRKASQRRTRRAVPSQVYVSRVWHPGDAGLGLKMMKGKLAADEIEAQGRKGSPAAST
jgi:hypothetical protein